MKAFYPQETKIVLAGGEPLLYQGIEELLAMVRSKYPKDQKLFKQLTKGFDTPSALFEAVENNKLVVTTNGTALSDRKISMLEHYGVTAWLSLDGVTPKVFENVRRGASFSKIEKNLGLAINRIPVHINFVIMEQTLEDVIPAIEFVERLGINLIRFTPVREISRAKTNGIKIFHEKFVALLEKALTMQRSTPTNTLVLFNLLQTQKVFLMHQGRYDDISEQFGQHPNMFLEEKKCQQLKDPGRGVVNPKGHYTGCCNASSLPYFDMGNLLKTPLATAIGHQPVLDIFEKTPELCANCDFLSVCKGGCRLMSYERYGNPLVMDPTCPFLDERLQS